MTIARFKVKAPHAGAAYGALLFTLVYLFPITTHGKLCNQGHEIIVQIGGVVAEAKIEIKVGAISFAGEGEGKWLSEQLDKILEKIPELSKVAPPEPEQNGGGKSPRTHKIATGTLASFLKEKNATTNQTRKFLATATWLQDREKRTRVSTNDVTTALSANSQTRLGNAADCLNKNVGKGFCEKDGKQFFVTEEGRAEIG
jgi:hypothetical protein